MAKDNELLTEFKKSIPVAGEISKMAILRGLSGEKKSPRYIKSNFSSLVINLQSDAYAIYLSEENKAWKKAIRYYCKQSIQKKAKLDVLISFLQENLRDFDSFFLSLSQSRRARAGSAFEEIIRVLFKKLGYPFTEQAVIDGKPDFLMPGRVYYEKYASDCIIFTVKRTLRERWRQIVTEGTAGRGFFLATIDEEISENSLNDMKNNRIYLVVPAELKSKIPHYKTAPNVISFEDFFEDYLDPAMKRWKKAGII